MPATVEVSESDATSGSEGGSAKEQKSEAAKENPMFEIRAELASGVEAVRLLHGQSGVIRFELPWEPMLTQWARKVRQLFQNRPA